MTGLRRPRLPMFLAVLAVLLAAGAQAPLRAATLASPWAEALGARARLVAGGAGEAGAPFAGIEIALEDGWKTYWRVPGDSGIPPRFDWSASTNLASAEVLYPAPSRLADPAGVTIGYKGVIVLPVRLVARDASAPIGLHLTLDYAACSDLCVPARAELFLAVPPAADRSPVVEAALDRVPRPVAGDGAPRIASVAPAEAAGRTSLIVKVRHPGDARAPDLFVEGPQDWYLAPAMPRGRQAPDGDLIVYSVAFGTAKPKTPLAGAPLRFTISDGAAAWEQGWVLPAR